MRLFSFVMKKLRSGYTTGACAAAAAKAAAIVLFSKEGITEVTIPFPDGSRVTFKLIWTRLHDNEAQAAVVKDAGDDPDVTNAAIIAATVRTTSRLVKDPSERINILGGKGVGTVTKPGLPVAVGKPAINPVPLTMITEAVEEARAQHQKDHNRQLDVIINVPQGEELAKKTLNKRLGIIGGISILGTTGIVKPISAEAWTATISTSMNVASAAGMKEIILSTGRSSETCVQAHLSLPDEALVMMGDYLEFALKETNKHGYRKIHMATMWAKLLKGAMKVPQTHVRHGVLDTRKIIQFYKDHGVNDTILEKLAPANTAREVLEKLLDLNQIDLITRTCKLAREHYRSMAEGDIIIHLVHGSGRLVCSL